MCERLCETMKETDNIILEYSTKNESNEVERFILGRLMLRPKINICGMFMVDLNSFLLVLAEILVTATTLIQLDYMKMFDYKKLNLKIENGEAYSAAVEKN
ncbi:uncharacterized protein LOC119603525 [Lucilia sericata]|uniref:uncharacterized protein LOC119603525 n=1 Tax=Lucilia sericata TaxID=13632 RepID=UPI0018A7FA77|nr:uncharacterized protein LOC119603525 [Lucilia sericata]